MLINPKSLSPVLVMISSMSVTMCNRFHITQPNSDKITTFLGGKYLYLTPVGTGLLEPKGSVLRLLKSVSC